jgi:hypothetical protein
MILTPSSRSQAGSSKNAWNHPQKWVREGHFTELAEQIKSRRR